MYLKHHLKCRLREGEIHDQLLPQLDTSNKQLIHAVSTPIIHYRKFISSRHRLCYISQTPSQMLGKEK